MKKLVFVSVVLATTAAAFAQAPSDAPATTRSTVNGDPSQIICRRENQIGTRLTQHRICRTRAEWTELREQTRQVVERQQGEKQTSGQ